MNAGSLLQQNDSLPDESTEKKPIRVLKFVPEGSPKRDKAKDIVALEEQVRVLREELVQTQRQLSRLETLLQNARLREQELRAELTRRK